jgi:D-tyrosyl-tRNA(Tyr) deacylase
MKALVQRVKKAQVVVENKIISGIGTGILVLLGVGHDDTQKDADWLVEKIINLRIFEDENGRMNISLRDINAELLVVSQFTLMGECRKGRRPSFANAAAPGPARDLYEYFISRAVERGITAKSGIFQAMMDISLINHGPVTLMLDTKAK